MAGTLVQSTIFSSTLSSERNVCSKRKFKVLCSLQTPPMRVTTFSRLHGVNALDNMVNKGQDFHSKVATSVTSIRKAKPCRIVPKALFEDYIGKDIKPKSLFERYTEKGIRVIMLAQEEARRLGHNSVGTNQILLGIIAENTSIASKILKAIGINLKDARVEVEKINGRGSGFVAVEIPFTQRAKSALEQSIQEARQLGHSYIGPEELLLGLLCEGEGDAARVLQNLGADLDCIRKVVIRIDKTDGISEALFAGYAKTLEEDRVPRWNPQTTKTNSETTEEKKDRVPRWNPQTTKTNSEATEEKKVITLDTGLLGELEESLKKIIKLSDEIILCIDKFHTLIGPRPEKGEGDNDAA